MTKCYSGHNLHNKFESFTYKKPFKTCVLKGSRVLCFDKSREEGIRTLDTVARIPTFQAGSFDHSDTSLNGECKSNVFS